MAHALFAETAGWPCPRTTLLLMAHATGRLGSDHFARWSKETGERELRQLLSWKWDPLGAVAISFPKRLTNMTAVRRSWSGRSDRERALL